MLLMKSLCIYSTDQVLRLLMNYMGYCFFSKLWNVSLFLIIYISLFNSLAPGRSECDSKNVIFNLVLLIGIFRSSHDNALRWIPQDLIDDKSTLVQVMAWGRQATSHYLSQCWPSSMSPYGVTRPQWVKGLRPVLEGFVVTMHTGACNRKSNPQTVRPRDLTYCSHKPECIVTTNTTDRS